LHRKQLHNTSYFIKANKKAKQKFKFAVFISLRVTFLCEANFRNLTTKCKAGNVM
jgi:hypothetical protein